MKKSSLIIIVILTSSLFFFTTCKTNKDSNVSDVISTNFVTDTGVTVTPDVPTEIVGGADNASLTQAAEFAWNEFIALNWPAVEQTGAANTRDEPDTSKLFGDQTSPLVWHTFRSKVEIYPWGAYPNGSKVQGNKLVFDYDALPEYHYKDSVPPCAEAASDVSFINLDETSEISLNFMFAGITPSTPTSTNSSPQLVRFLAKGNRTYFDYVTDKNYFNHGGSYYDDVTRYENAVATDKVVPDSTVITFPTGTIMLKAAWRLLTDKDTLSQFHTTKVRYYEKKNDNPCYYQEDTWGLVALHIVQKTPSSPYFTFATFEQKDNILTSDGKPVEDANGKVINPFSNPTDPVVNHTDSASGPTMTTIDGSYCDADDSRLNYQNTAAGLPSDGKICVNGRYHDIPQEIIDVNKAAHQAISNYNSENNVTSSPWENYKLVNIQYQPFNSDEISDENNRLESTYYQANIVVETNYTLQKFAGQQIATGNEAGQTSNYAGGQPFYNVHIPNGEQYTKINMGGCMGCHGNAQFAGNDFSFMLRGGPVVEPDVPEFDTENILKLAKKYASN